ncbi:transcription factor SRM1-like [Rhodamnia argentea]|uniref:Transcription factor SRM1-like n=1 Tax=Rhodamnia argentea TaxID=178133 RepID=A0A8B8PM65_9MYRT|nr:transcription factor SRM1-like [Rhodamnia argentea]
MSFSPFGLLHMESQYYFEAMPHGGSYLTYLLSPPTPPEPINDHWTVEENQIFERCIAEFDHLSRDFFEEIALQIPRKSVGQIQRHYEALVEDVAMIESGQVPVPEYGKSMSMVDKRTKPRDEASESKSTHQAPRRRGVAWSREEHELFLEGLEKYGKGDWKSISRNCVKTRNPTQVASHAQKYFKRLKNHSDRRRFSQLADLSALPSTSEAIDRPSIYMPSLRLASIGTPRSGLSLAYYLGKN